jgi:hypothetical protein
MNRQIQELASKHLQHEMYAALKGGDYYEFDPEELQEFVQSIVRECIKEIEFQYGGGSLMEDGETHNPEWDNAIECVSAMIEKHLLRS